MDMLRAINICQESVLAQTAKKGEIYHCPYCDEEVILRQGRIRISHFAHQTSTTCPLSITESIGHIEMKSYISQMLSVRYPSINIEVPVGNKIVDIVIRDSSNRGYAIECQYSPTTVRELEERTRFLNANQLSAIWVWSSKRFKPYGDGEWKIPQDILNCHKLAFGRVYYFDHNSKKLLAAHFEPATRWRDEAYNQNGELVGGYEVILKTVRNIKFAEVPLQFKSYISSSGRLELAELGDGVFWKSQKRRFQ